MNEHSPEEPFISSDLRPPYKPNQELNPPANQAPPEKIQELARNVVRLHDHHGLAHIENMTLSEDILSQVFSAGPDVQWSSLDDEVVVVNVENGCYYTLNRVGSALWEMLASGVTSEQILAKICSRFEVTEDVARRDMMALARRLLDEGLIQPLSQPRE